MYMTNIQNLSKICLVCGDTFCKKSNCSLKNWESRTKYCSKECSNNVKRVYEVISESKKCIECKNIFYRKDSKKALHSTKYWNNKQYCSKECSNKKQPWNTGTVGLIKPNSGSFKKGIISFSKGKKFPEWSGENNPNWKPKISKTCCFCSKEVLLPPHRIIEDKKFFCNRVCWALGSRNENSPVFKGEDAVAPIRKRIMELSEHKQWHSEILKRDSYLCVLCKSRKDLEVDHIKRFLHIVNQNNIKTTEQARNCKELWDISNGRTLCRECHRKTDTYGTKGLKKHY